MKNTRYNNSLVNLLLMTLLFVFQTAVSLAQNPINRNLEYEDLLPDFQHMSPEMSSLGEYGNVGMDFYTGQARIEVPLLSIEAGSFELPISISYITGGIGVDKEASLVGLGWNLSCGGHISHIINGNDDALDNGSAPQTSYQMLLSKILPITSNSYSDQRACHKTVDWTAGTAIASLPQSGSAFWEEYFARMDILGAISSKCYVPDIYQATFCGRSISFSILETGEIIPIQTDGHVYTFSVDGTYCAPSKITIIDDMGIKYEFGIREYSGATVSGYWLTDILTPRNEHVTFTYSTNMVLSSSRLFESEAFLYSGHSTTGFLEGLRQIYNQDNLMTKYCTSVTTDCDVVTLTYADRADFNGGKQLVSVIDRSPIDGTVKHTAFLHHSYFFPSTGDGETSVVSMLDSLGMRNGARLRLDSIVSDGKSYSFIYDSIPLPSKTSTAKDLWGLYNGAVNNGHLLASPKYKIAGDYIQDEHYRGGADRHSSELFGKAGSLSQIIYPTGGSTKIGYELHSFRDAMQYYYPPTGSIPYDIMNYIASSHTGNYGTHEKTFTLSKTTVVDITVNLHVESPSTQSATGVIVGVDVPYTRTFTTSASTPSLTESISDTLLQGTYKLISFATPVGTSGATSSSISTSYRVFHPAADSKGGGLRVSSLTNYDTDGSTFLGGQSFTYTGGHLLVPTQHLSFIREDHPGGSAYYELLESESSDLPAAYYGKPTVGYDEVRVTPLGGNFGHVDHKFVNPHPTGSPHHYYYTGDVWYGGRPSQDVVIAADGDTMSVTNWNYCHIRPSDYVLYTRCITSYGAGASFDCVTFDLDTYPLRDDWVFPVSMETITYFAGIPSRKVVTRMWYNEVNRQLTCRVNDYVTGCDSLIFSYPTQSSDTLLWRRGMKSVITESKSFHKSAGDSYNLVDGRKLWHTASNVDNSVALDRLSRYGSDGELSTVFRVTDHGPCGNIREYVKPDGTVGSILWSYNNQHPVMHIEGASCADIEAAGVHISALGRMASPSVSYLKAAKQSIETSTDALVTLYLYDKACRVVEIVSKTGLSTHYQYDSFGRLITTRDNEMRILESIEYNYAR